LPELTSRDAYVKMKAKEKGIPDSEVQRGKPTAGGKWNAFREMNKIKSGGSPMLAKIPDGVKVVGTPGGIHQRERDNGRKRNRDDDGEEGSSKREKVDVRYTASELGA
jgi:lupus La protein